MKFIGITIMIACFALSVACEEETGPGPTNRIMGTGEPTHIKPLTPEDHYLEAARQGDLSGVRKHLKAGANPDARDGLGSSAFLLAVRKTDNLELIRFVREQSKAGALDGIDHRARTPLSWAAQKGSLGVMGYLLDAGADLERADQDRRSPLFHAVLAGQVEAVRLLIRKGARVNVQDTFGDTPLMMAAMKGRVEIAKLLLAAGADSGLKNQEGLTVLDRVRDAKMRALLSAAP